MGAIEGLVRELGFALVALWEGIGAFIPDADQVVWALVEVAPHALGCFEMAWAVGEGAGTGGLTFVELHCPCLGRVGVGVGDGVVPFSVINLVYHL